MLLTADTLAIHRGTRLLLDSFSCRLMAGQALWLTGPNGIGKSTLLQVLTGVRPPLRGTVTISCDNIYLPSLAGFDPALTIIENLQWWAAVHQAEAVPIAGALKTWGLEAQAHASYASLSQGQQQRAALARLSLCPAPVWILDEPLSHLDADGIALFTNAVTAHLLQGGAMIAATHGLIDLPQAQVIELVAA